jgi:hypothetical protein
VVDLESATGAYLIDPSFSPFARNIRVLIQDGDKIFLGPGRAGRPRTRADHVRCLHAAITSCRPAAID